jgi:glutamate 5-kinase
MSVTFGPLPHWRRLVLKVGSGLISPNGEGCKTQALLPIARFISESLAAGKEIILVSSGAVAAGRAVIPELKSRRSIPEKQALAAIGQTLMMDLWQRLLDVNCAQILLTHDDFRNRRRFVNVKTTLRELLKLRAMPIVNENDSVAVDELKVGDNDNLAAQVAVLAEADLLIILSDIDGLYTSNPHSDPNARLITHVEKVDTSIFALAGDTQSHIATGGMVTKLQAAQKAADAGIYTVIANGNKSSSLDVLLSGKNPGTLFAKEAAPITAKKHWLSHSQPSQGKLFIDRGAGQALKHKGASLLPAGIVNIEGTFFRGDAVDIYILDGSQDEHIARGLTQYGSDAMALLKGQQSDQIADILGYRYLSVAVHRSDMALFLSEHKEETV